MSVDSHFPHARRRPSRGLLALAVAAALAAAFGGPAVAQDAPTTPPGAPASPPSPAKEPTLPAERVDPRPAATPAVADPAIVNSALDAGLFLQLLVAEIELRSGEPGNAFQLLLDAARKTRDEQIFRRTADVALQARAGDQALQTVTAWRQALPGSEAALRYQVQILVALNRTREAEEPMAALLRTVSPMELPALIDAVPRLVARNVEQRTSADLVDRVLEPYASATAGVTATPSVRAAALVAMARGSLSAGDAAKAVERLDAASRLDPAGTAAPALALELVAQEPAAEAIVERHLQASAGGASAATGTATRLAYVRALAGAQRYDKATRELEAVTKAEPGLAPPWLTLGAIELERKRPREATAALETYVRLVEGGAAVTLGPAPPPTAAEDDDEGDAPASSAVALTQARLLLAQAAEQAGDFPAAERQLARIESPERALQVQVRRASLLAKQNRLEEARELIRRAPEQTQADARAKVSAEVELLRERKLWAAAGEVYGRAERTWPDDIDFVYEHAMIDEKLERFDAMEQKLRRVIALRADHQHAYNALGYSLADRKTRLPEARTLIARALELSPGDPFITDSLGWVEYRLGNRAEAVRLLRRAYQARPDAEIAAHLGEVLWADGQQDEARTVWREGRQKDAGNDVLRETLARLRVDL